MTAVQGSILGNTVLRREDPSLLRGVDQFYDDLDIPGLAHIAFVRSPFAHASIVSIDIAEALELPGVIAVHTAETLELPNYQSNAAFDDKLNRPPLAKGKVRYVGDIVAAVVAETREAAADACEAVDVEYDPLPVVIDPEAALQPDAPLLFEEYGSNVVFESSIDNGEDPLADAAKIVSGRVVSQRLAGVPMEVNGCLAVPDQDRVEVWIPSQNPISVKASIVSMCGLDADKVRVAAPAVGGGFGPKAGAYAEFFIVTKAAISMGRALKWTEDRSENMVAMGHGRAMIMDAKLGFSEDGVITGMDVEVLAEAGAYPAVGAILILFTQTMIQGVYDIPKIRYKARSVITNTTQTVAYRGAGRPEATQLLERVMDMAADELQLDPTELRRKNLLQAGDFPLTTLGNANYDNGEYEMVLDAVMAAADYQGLLETQKQRRESSDPKQLGIGVSVYVEVTAPAGLHIEYGAVEITQDGSVVARVGTSAHGQGHITSFSMIISEMLGVPMDKITILQSDSDEVPRGLGTMGSRSLQTAGSAVHVASETVLEKAKRLAAHLLEANVDDLVTSGDGLQVVGDPASAISWAELANAANDDLKRPTDMEPGLSHELDFDGTDSTFPFGAHIAVVEVDMETGAVELLRHVAVDDCGRILNPLVVTGQQHGGIAQGAAQALYEAVAYDELGNPTTSNLMNYAIPSAAELCFFETSNTETPSPRNPLGAKGIGESGTIGSTPAIHNAVVDAVSHLGIKHIDMPLTAERVWQAINDAK